jgi:hypothetical protein
VNLAASRTVYIWEHASPRRVDNRGHFVSPQGLPTADGAISDLGCHWKRQVHLLNLTLKLAAARTGRRLGDQRRLEEGWK